VSRSKRSFNYEKREHGICRQLTLLLSEITHYQRVTAAGEPDQLGIEAGLTDFLPGSDKISSLHGYLG